ncbi:MAG: type II toxin-antitoxin system VapC family toxin [Verrucomicrobiales bacterium]|nr:type II toxin-antitoxin system VapC family toxin [Verrucomicrobiales bacterium]
MPASGDILLDSSVVIPFLKGDVTLRANFLASQSLYLPQTVLGELYCGAHLSSQPAKSIAQIENFLAGVILLSPGAVTAEHYGRIRAQLARAGTPIPENDIWIAALALEHQLPLAARDAHFDFVAGLQVKKW